MLYNEEIILAGYNESPYLFARLQRVIGFIYGIASHYDESTKILTKLRKLYDHKGLLIVHWKETPTVREKEFFRLAWASIIGDGSSSVHHAEPGN